MSFPVPPPKPRPIPDEGIHNAVVCAVVDMGDVLNDYPGKPPEIVRCARFFFELDEKIPPTVLDALGQEHAVDPDIIGKPFMIYTYDVPLKSGERSNLRKILDGLLGKSAPQSLVGFDLSSLEGMQASVNVQHKERDDGSLVAFLKPNGIGKPMAKAGKVERTIMGPPSWIEDQRKKNAEEVERFRRTSGARAVPQNARGEDAPDQSFDEVPF